MPLPELINAAVIVGYGAGIPIVTNLVTGDQDTLIASMVITLVVTPLLVSLSRMVNRLGRNTDALHQLTVTILKTSEGSLRSIRELADRNAAKTDELIKIVQAKQGFLRRLFGL